jgi:TetR/AcrR family transcriptional regulator, ethionamide resistance regulator
MAEAGGVVEQPGDGDAVARARRPRHDPKQTEREILEAAETLLRERPFREVTIPEVMRTAGLTRPAFYAHFRDRGDLLLRVVAHIGALLFEMADRWLEGDEPLSDIPAAVDGVADVYVIHGPVLRALADAAPTDAAVEQAYRGLVQAFVDASHEHIAAEQAAGRIRPSIDAAQMARALVWGNERVLSETLGRVPQADPREVATTLSEIWLATLYGELQGGSRA